MFWGVGLPRYMAGRLEKVREKLGRAQTVGPGDLMPNKRYILHKGMPFFDLGLRYSENTDILERSEMQVG